MNTLDHNQGVVERLTRVTADVTRVMEVARVALSAYDSESVECPRYLTALEKALRDEPPPFGTELYSQIYAEASQSGQWLAISLMTNAEREGDGATRLWSLAACAFDAEEQQLLKRHAVDESRHALAYLALLDLCFPGAVTPEFRAELDGLSPHYSITKELFAVASSPYARTPSIDDYMQMNIAEIRTTIHHLMQREAIDRHCPVPNRQKAKRILNSLLKDELKHVAYTAILIERKSTGGGDNKAEEFESLFCKRFRDFNYQMSEELIEYSYNQRFGNYP